MTIERRYSGGFDVTIPTSMGHTVIDTVFYTNATVDEVKRGLIDHDGYQSDISVWPCENPHPFNDTELTRVCDENDVTITPDVGDVWHWTGSDAHGNDRKGTADSERDAMLEAVAELGLEEQYDDEKL